MANDDTARRELSEALRQVLAGPPKHLKGEALREYWFDEIRDDGFNIMSAPFSIQDDKEAALLALRTHGMLLCGVSPRLQNDYDVVYTAVRTHGVALDTASDAMKNNMQIVLTAVQQDGLALQYASDSCRNNPILIFMAFKNNGDALEYAGDKIKNEQAYVLVAIKQCGEALRHVPDRLKYDKEIVCEAVQQSGEAIRYAPEKLRNDRFIVSKAMKSSPVALEYASIELQRDPEMNFAQSLIRTKARNMLTQDDNHGDNNFPHALWANILAKGSNNPYYLYYYLTNKPDLIKGAAAEGEDFAATDAVARCGEIIAIWIMMKALVFRLLLVFDLYQKQFKQPSLRKNEM